MSQQPQGPQDQGPQGPQQPYDQRPQQVGWQGQQPQPSWQGQQPPTTQQARAFAVAAKAHRKAMRPWFKKKRFIIPLALIALVLLGRLLPSDDSTPTTTAPGGSTSSAAAPVDESTGSSAPPKATKTSKSEPAKAGVGDTVKGGDWEFRVTKFKCGVKRVGSEYLDKTAQGQFCLMNISVKNNGKKAETLTGGNQKLYDADDREFSDDFEASTYEDPDSNLFLESINPGNTKKGLVVFDIPNGVKPVRAELAGGFLGLDPATVDLS